MRKYVWLLAAGFFIVTLFWLNEKSYADKGRKHYEKEGQILWEIKTDEKVVALTFDDGPHKKYTPEILEVLSRYGAKATFFIIGQYADNHPSLTLRIHEEGHELAIHTYTHPLKTNVRNLINEIKETHSTIYGITGYAPVLFRPVEGQYTDEMIDAISKAGYKVVMWSWHLDTFDWKRPGTKKIVETVLDGVEPGSVVLLHDGGGNREQTVAALEEILPELQKQGYKFVTISELLKIQQNEPKK